MKILFFGDGLIAAEALEHLVALRRCEIVGVVLRRVPQDDMLSVVARKYDLRVFQPENVNAESFLNLVARLAPDLNLSVNYDQIFKWGVISSARLGTLNCHNGLLPDYRGGGGLYGAVVNNERWFGQTIHLVNESIDAGDIILQDILPIGPDDTMEILLGKAAENAPQLIRRAIEVLAQGQVRPRKQDHLPGSYFPKKPEGDEIIDWSEPSLLIYNKIRARNPGPGNVTYLGEQGIIIWTASLTKVPNYIGPVGQVIGREPGLGVWVKTGDSAIRVETIQFEGETERRVAAFKIGTTFLANWRNAYLKLQQKCALLEERLTRLEAQLVLYVDSSEQRS